MSLRLRLTILYTLLFAALIGLFGTIVYLQTSRSLYNAVDDTLKLRADRILLESGTDPSGAIDTDQSVLDELGSPGVYVELLRNGKPPVRSSNLTAALPVPSRLRRVSETASFETHHTSNGERVRVLYQDLPNAGGRLLVARSLHPTDAALDRIRVILIGGGVGFLIIANALAYLVAALALRPIREASGAAAEIEATADFTRRIGGEQQPGEVGELVGTMNELIAKVEQTLDAHRAFLADSSHELRRPLAVLRGNLGVLGNPSLSAEERQEIIAETDDESRRMSRILADLLLLSQVDARLILQLAPLDLTELVRSVAEHERQRFPAREIVVAKNGGPVRIEADGERVRQVIENLVENAAQYSTPGRPIEIAVRSNGRFAVAEVTDHGPGLSEEEARRAFERFYRGHRSRRQHADGSGLGLAIVRHIAEAHGGGVALTSTAAGTMVKVELPLSGGKT